MDAFTIIDVKADGSTEPRLDADTEILLVQDGEVNTGLLCFDGEDGKDGYIVHPANQDELDPIALKLVKEQCPQHLQTKTSVVLICPEELAERMVF